MVLVGITLAVHMHQQQMGPEGLVKHRLGQDLRRRAKSDQTPVQTGDLTRADRHAGKVVGAQDYGNTFRTQLLDYVQ